MPQKNEKKYSVGDIVSFSVIVLLCAAMAVLDFVKIRYTSDAVNNELISDTVPLAVGSIAVIWLMIRGKTRLFPFIRILRAKRSYFIPAWIIGYYLLYTVPLWGFSRNAFFAVFFFR